MLYDVYDCICIFLPKEQHESKYGLKSDPMKVAEKA